MLFRLIEPSQVNECELVGHTDQQFSDITLKLQNTPVIRSIPNIHGRYIKQIQWFKKKNSLKNLKLTILQFLNSKIMLIKSLMKLVVRY